MILNDDGLFVSTYPVNDGIISADGANGLTTVDGTLRLNLATEESAGAMSKEDKIIVDSLPEVYVARKYDIANIPIGTLIDYRDHEIRIMVPADAKFEKQAIDGDYDPNKYYISFKTYAPINAVSFKRGDKGVVNDAMLTFDNVNGAIDKLNRKYSICWLPIASYDPNTSTWEYFGKDSVDAQYIGWSYVIEWYDDNGIKIGFDSIQINLSNEQCHYVNKPYYLENYATAEDIQAVKETVSTVEESYVWDGF